MFLFKINYIAVLAALAYCFEVSKLTESSQLYVANS